jgi:hypothetical protein
MLAYFHRDFPLVYLLIGIAFALVIVAASRPGGGGKKKAKIAELQARVDALERKP